MASKSSGKHSLSFFKDNGLSIALLGLFGFSEIGHYFAGWGAEN